ncbi:MAG: S1C family serine protease [Ilumatobacteraceae bacterium]
MAGRHCVGMGLAAVGVLLATGCGGDDGGVIGASTTVAVVDSTPDTTDGGGGGEVVSSLDDVVSAMVRIDTRGGLVHPEFGAYEYSGGGSGFFVDPSGIAVTNNHVVTGVAALEVFVGEEDEPRNAQVLGVSECSDLAVIDVEGDGFPYLEWYDGEIRAGLDVYAAGYPTPETIYALTSGIVANTRASGEMTWASVDSVIEHDAGIRPGSSGGPLVTQDGKVVGINYAYNEPIEGASEQQFAISEQGALPIIDALSAGEDVLSLGVNGVAVADPDNGIYGVWVQSAETGSPAGELGLEGGDIITKIEGLTLGTDGTMKDYCDILQSHQPSDPLSVQVLRFATEEYLTGEFNGDELGLQYSFADQVADDLGDEIADAPDDAGGAEPSAAGSSSFETDYVLLTDDYGVLQVEVPADWSDVDSFVPFNDADGNEDGTGIMAAPNLADFNDTWGTPGMAISARALNGSDFDPELLLDWNRENLGFLDACTEGERQDYDDGLYTGLYQTFSACGDTETEFVTIAAGQADGLFEILVNLQVVTSADLDVLDRVIQTFQVTGDVPGLIGDPGEYESYTEYMTVTDDYGAIQVEVPVEWSEVDSYFPLTRDDGSEVGTGLAAAPSLQGFFDEWETPGIVLLADPQPLADPDQWLDDYAGGVLSFVGDCVDDGREDYDDGWYQGRIQYFSDCSDTGNVYVWIAAGPPSGEFGLFVEVNAVTTYDLDALDRIMATFQVLDASAIPR